ncbi:MAG: LysM peptidoglycan-binding domain-containing protein [Planctomycetes bacterium]|nr:LysM peptidoglycan-binding domain-containing protein [Planctomycetota bacterium]
MLHHIPERRHPWRPVIALAIIMATGTLVWMVRPGRAAPPLSVQRAPSTATAIPVATPTPIAAPVVVSSASASVPTATVRQVGSAPSSRTGAVFTAGPRPVDASLHQDTGVSPPVSREPQPAALVTIANPAPALSMEQIVAQMAVLVAAKDSTGLRTLLGLAVINETHDAAWRRSLWPRLEELNTSLVFSTAPSAGFHFEKVRRGDSLWSICQRLKRSSGINVASGLLSAINHTPASGLKVGAQLKVPGAEVSVLVDKSDFRLYLLLDGVPFHHVPVGTGREDLTPEDHFLISSRVVRPDWTDPSSGRTIKYGDAGHLIGSRWLGFSRGAVKTGFGIHGTVQQDSVGKAMSDGCIRLGEADLVRIFEWIPEGAEVHIRP